MKFTNLFKKKNNFLIQKKSFLIFLMKNKEKRLFLVIVFLAAFSCFGRADYNLPLFIFSYVLWDLRSEKASLNKEIHNDFYVKPKFVYLA